MELLICVSVKLTEEMYQKTWVSLLKRKEKSNAPLYDEREEIVLLSASDISVAYYSL